MTKSELFKKAHQLTKSVIKAGDDYRITFGLAIKAILSETTKSIPEQLIEMGCTIWEKHGKKRIYMSVAQFNAVTGYNYSLNDRNNKIFFDYAANAIMRSYKGKRPTIEIQF